MKTNMTQEYQKTHDEAQERVAVSPTRLLGCPFCGGEPYEEQFPTLHIIGCKLCGYNLHGKGIMSDAATEPCGNGMVKFVSGGTLEHQTRNRSKWNTRWQPNKKLSDRRQAAIGNEGIR